jgi:hypothetical protein
MNDKNDFLIVQAVYCFGKNPRLVCLEGSYRFLKVKNLP